MFVRWILRSEWCAVCTLRRGGRIVARSLGVRHCPRDAAPGTRDSALAVRGPSHFVDRGAGDVTLSFFPPPALRLRFRLCGV